MHWYIIPVGFPLVSGAGGSAEVEDGCAFSTCFTKQLRCLVLYSLSLFHSWRRKCCGVEGMQLLGVAYQWFFMVGSERAVTTVVELLSPAIGPPKKIVFLSLISGRLDG